MGDDYQKRDGEEYHGKRAWEPQDDKRSVQLPSEWWDRQCGTPITATETPAVLCLINIIALAAEGKLNRSDLQIVTAIVNNKAAGCRMLAKALPMSKQMIQYRLKRLRALMNT